MPSVLLITFCYPPQEIIGARRPAGLAKHLPRFGWNVQALTPQIPGQTRQSPTVVETGYRNMIAVWKSRLHLDIGSTLHEQLGLSQSSKIRTISVHTRVMQLARDVLTYPDAAKGWIPFAVKAVKDLKRQGARIDAIITTSPPITAHLIGREAKRILGCPWIADLRDLWTQNLAADHHLLRRLERGLEKRTFHDADVLVTVSEPWAARLRARYADKPVCAIPNGFDPDEFNLPPQSLTEKFTMTYAGRLYEGRRDPTPVFAVIRDLVDDGLITSSDLCLRFYGPLEPWLPETIRQYGLEKVVQVNGVVPREQVLLRESESQVLLMLGWSDERENGQHTGKLFEYLGARRPVLAVGGSRGVLTDLLGETRAGTHALSKPQLRAAVLQMYTDYKRLGCVPYNGDIEATLQYSHLAMARKFGAILDRCLAERKGGAAATAFTSDARHELTTK